MNRKNNMTAADRIYKLLEELDLTIAEVEREVEFANGTLWRFLNKAKQKPDMELTGNAIEKLSGRYPNLNREWLKTGKGEMKLNPSLPLDGRPGAVTLELDYEDAVGIRLVADFLARVVSEGGELDPEKHMPTLKAYTEAYLKLKKR